MSADTCTYTCARAPWYHILVHVCVHVCAYVDQANFVPFIVETGPSTGGDLFLDTLPGALHALRGVTQALALIQLHARRQWCEGGSESACPAFAPSLNWLPCILPQTHVVLSAHMSVCALCHSESCDILT
jgi:hypothetical protein